MADLSGSRPRSSGEGSSYEDPDIMEIPPSSARCTSSHSKGKQSHEVVPCEVDIDEGDDQDGVEIISTRNSHQSIKEELLDAFMVMSIDSGSKNECSHSILDNSEPTAKMLCKNEQATIFGDEIDIKFKSFKQFDIVQDHSDHTFSRLDLMASSASGEEIKMISPPKKWIKRIHYEWKILEEALPETIYVRAYEGRMDLLRAVIIGAAGTPYHDGLFFFDVYFHSKYPRFAPFVVYHSIGLQLNPHMGSDGSICLSLLSNFGKGSVAWCPKSTMLQVLVSLQGLVLTANPLFNDGILPTRKSDVQMKSQSRAANEEFFLASCRTMLYSLWKPPKNFEDLIAGHFRKRGRAILTACLAYLDGAQVGCVDEDVIWGVDEGDNSSDSDFRSSLGCLICDMMREFTAKGADCNDLKLKVNAAVAAARAKTGQYSDSHSRAEENLQNAITGVPSYKRLTAMHVDVIFGGS